MNENITSAKTILKNKIAEVEKILDDKIKDADINANSTATYQDVLKDHPD